MAKLSYTPKSISKKISFVSKTISIIERFRTSHINSYHNTSLYCKEVWYVKPVNSIILATTRVICSAERYTAGSSAKVILEKNACTARDCAILFVCRRLFANLFKPTAPCLEVFSFAIHPQFSTLNFRFFPLFITDFSRSASCRLAQPVPQPIPVCLELQSPVSLADQTAPIHSIHTTTFRRINLLPSPRHIAGHDLSSRRRSAAAMESRASIGRQNVCNTLLLYDLYTTWWITLASTSLKSS